MIFRGEVWWADLGEPAGSRPAGRRPVLVVQSDTYSASRLATVVVVAITRSTRLAGMPGNVFGPAGVANLAHDSVVNVTSVTTLDQRELEDKAGDLPEVVLAAVDAGLTAVLGLSGRR